MKLLILLFFSLCLALSAQVETKWQLIRGCENRKMMGFMQFVPQKNGSIQFTYEISVDPGGKIPKWMVNAMATDFPFYTLKSHAH